MEKRVALPRPRWLPYALVAPQIAITLVFFFWPAGQALCQSLLVAGRVRRQRRVRRVRQLPRAVRRRATTSRRSRSPRCSRVLVAALGLSISLVLAVFADRVVRGAHGLQDAADLALRRRAGGRRRCCGCSCSTRRSASSRYWLQRARHRLELRCSNGDEALILVVIAAVWKQISYNFLFFLAGLQSIPKSLIEAAAIDGAGPVRRFVTIVFPLLSPTTFFLLVVNIVYAFFDTFGDHRRGDRRRAGAGDRDPRLQGLQGRLQGARPRRLGRAVGGPDGDRRSRSPSCSSASSSARCSTA